MGKQASLDFGVWELFSAPVADMTMKLFVPKDARPFFHQVIDPSKGIADVPEWFKGSRLNYAENLLKHKENDKIALYAARK